MFLCINSYTLTRDNSFIGSCIADTVSLPLVQLICGVLAGAGVFSFATTIDGADCCFMCRHIRETTKLHVADLVKKNGKLLQNFRQYIDSSLQKQTYILHVCVIVFGSYVIRQNVHGRCGICERSCV